MALETSESGSTTVSGTVKVEDASGNDTTGGDMTADALVAAAIQALDVRAFLAAFNGTTLDRLRSGANNASSVSAQTTGVLQTMACLYGERGGDWDRLVTGGSNSLSQSTSSEGFLKILNMNYGYNSDSGVWRGLDFSTLATLLSSASRTATTATSAQTNYSWRGLYLFVDVTDLEGGTPSMTLQFQAQDPVSSNWVTLWTADTTFNTVATTAILIHPSANDATTDHAALPAPYKWRVNMVHADGQAITYSLGCQALH